MFIKVLIKTSQIFGAIILSVSLIGCSTDPNSKDRYECMNRAVYGFNKQADRIVLKPTARIYEAIVPKPLRNMVSNFFQNLGEIPTVGNDILQGKLLLASHDTARFLLNSTWGVGGLFDVAGRGGLEKHRQDFGLTLAQWGYKDSAYVVLPLFGPSTCRDTIGRMVTFEMGIPAHLKSVAWRNRLMVANYIDIRTSLLKVEPAIDESIDEYVFIRDAYLQHRQYEINGEEAGAESKEIKLDGPPA